MTEPTNESLIGELLLLGAEDWFDLGWVLSVFMESAADTAVTEERVMGLLDEIFTRGLIEPGDVTGDGFVPWSLSKEEALERILHEWRRVGRPTIGDVVWLSNTPEGDRRANELLAERAASNAAPRPTD